MAGFFFARSRQSKPTHKVPAGHIDKRKKNLPRWKALLPNIAMLQNFGFKTFHRPGLLSHLFGHQFRVGTKPSFGTLQSVMRGDCKDGEEHQHRNYPKQKVEGSFDRKVRSGIICPTVG